MARLTYDSGMSGWRYAPMAQAMRRNDGSGSMEYTEVLEAAKGNVGPYCHACRVCDGRACGSSIPGPGAKGDGAVRNHDAWADVHVNMDTISSAADPDLSFELFGKAFRVPIFAAPIGAITNHFGDAMDDARYSDDLVSGCAAAGIAAFTGDGLGRQMLRWGTEAIARSGGAGVPTIKPWDAETIREKMEDARGCGAFAIAMDVDAAGLPFLRQSTVPSGPKTPGELSEIVEMAGDTPFIVKGIMTPQGAEKAVEAGASAIVVSNHGGRVLESCPATAEVLGDIADRVAGRAAVLVDGGIRSGLDVFKALALGADAVLICRPFAVAVHGGGAEGAAAYASWIAKGLWEAMQMCGAPDLASITRDMVVAPNRR